LVEADHPVAVASEIVDTQLGGVLSLELDVRAPASAAPDVHTVMTEMTRWARAQPQVRTVVGPRTHADPAETRARSTLRVPDVGGRAFERLHARAQAQLDALTTGTEVDAVAT